MRNIYAKLSILIFTISWGVSNAQYCTPNFTRDWAAIDGVEMTNGLVNLNNQGSLWNGASIGYNDYTVNNIHRYECIPGQTVNYTIRVSTNWNGASGGGASVWIDWDDSKTFDTPERVVANSSGSVQNGTFTVPTMYNGQPTAGKTYRMRVMSHTSTSSAPSNPCNSGTGGEAEDYNFTVIYEENAALSKFSAPSLPLCALGDSVVVDLMNNSNTALDSVTIQWSKNDTMQTAVKWSGSLTLGQTPLSIKLGNLTYNYGDTIKAWLSLVNGDTLDDYQGDDTLITIPQPALKGVYTVGGSTADFDTLHKALSALHAVGICGDVTFSLNSGKHYQLTDIGQFPGFNSGDKLSFISTAGHPDSAKINYSSTSSASNRVIGLQRTNNIYFKNLTIEDTSSSSNSGLVDISGSSNISFKNCYFKCTYTSTSGNAKLVRSTGLYHVENIAFDSCAFWNGYTAIEIQTGTNINDHKDIRITNCSFNNHYLSAVEVYDAENVWVQRNWNYNSTRTPSGGSYYIDVRNASGTIHVTNNSNTATLRSMRRSVAVRNSSGKPNDPILICNNIMNLGDSTSSIDYSAIELDNSKFVNVYHNTMSVLGTNASGDPLYVNNCGAVNIRNNIFTAYGSGRVFRINGSSSINKMDNNVLYSDADFGRFGNITIQSMASWNSTYGFEANGVSVDPMFSDSTLKSCHNAIDNIGYAIPNNKEDFTGTVRSTTTPDPGAYEFSSPLKFAIGDAFSICDKDSIKLQADVAGSDMVIWNGTDTSKSWAASKAGKYFAQLVGACGNAADTFTVDVNEVVKLPNDTNLCAGEVLTVNTNLTNAQYAWNTKSNTNSINVNTPGQYFVDVIDSSGCFSSDTIEVTVSVAVDLPNDTSICKGNTVDLNPGTGSGTYSWSNGSTASRIFADSSSTYWVEFTDPLNCVSRDTTIVKVWPLPDANFTQSQFSQTNWEFTAKDTTGIRYNWSFGNGKVDTGRIWKTVAIYDTNRVYKVTLTVISEHCGQATSSKEIQVIGVSVDDAYANNSGVNVYPNPTNGKLNINLSSVIDQQVELKIIDLTGKVILTESVINSGHHSLNLNDYSLSTGIYQLTLSNEEEIIFNGKITLQ